jgi:hypothetical protein
MNYEAITAWAAVASTLVALLGVRVAYYAFKSQVRSLAGSVSADLALKLAGDFDSEVSIARRGRVANAFLNNLRIAEADDVFDFFEQIGFFVRKGIIEADVAHSFFFHWVNLYWNAGKRTIAEKRVESDGLWKDFEFLYQQLLNIEITTDPRSRFINPSAEIIKKGLEEELQ